MNMTNDEYRRYAERHAPRSRVGRNCLGAFLVGGAICCLGQLLFTLWQSAGLDTADWDSIHVHKPHNCSLLSIFKALYE